MGAAFGRQPLGGEVIVDVDEEYGEVEGAPIVVDIYHDDGIGTLYFDVENARLLGALFTQMADLVDEQRR